MDAGYFKKGFRTKLTHKVMVEPHTTRREIVNVNVKHILRCILYFTE
jgi:hypothetical protein